MQFVATQECFFPFSFNLSGAEEERVAQHKFKLKMPSRRSLSESWNYPFEKVDEVIHE